MIKLYTTHCPLCRTLKAKLDKSEIAYEICEDTDEMMKKGFTSAPMLEVDDKYLNFSEALKWLHTR